MQPDPGRAKDRERASLSLPKALKKRLQSEADADIEFPGDLTRAVIRALARVGYSEALEFLRNETTSKHNPKKAKGRVVRKKKKS